MDGARQAAERVARASYGRLLSLLVLRTRDIAAAEEALSEAFRRALESWPERGVPGRPEAWLLVVARRVHGREGRRAAVHERAVPLLAWLDAGRAAPDFPDERLKLLFVCAHPAIDPAARTPLMLQTVLGLDARSIAAAFVTSPAAMAQRLVRAKAKIRDAALRFEHPEARELPGRLAAVLDAIYAAYGTAWNDGIGTGLGAEAVFLARLVAALLPDQPEARGLLALMLYCQSRAAARRSPEGAFVPLDEQDTALWSTPMIDEAEAQLRTAAAAGNPGRYQIEAAIQSVHAQRARTGTVDRRALVLLYDLLAARWPSIGVLVARAAAHGEAAGPPCGLDRLAEIDPASIAAYQPFWAVRAHLLARQARNTEAAEAYDRAIGLSDDPAVRAHLARRRAESAASTRTSVAVEPRPGG